MASISYQMKDIKGIIETIKYKEPNPIDKKSLALNDLERWNYLNDSMSMNKLEALIKPSTALTKDNSTQTTAYYKPSGDDRAANDKMDTKELYSSFSSSSFSNSSSFSSQNYNQDIELWRYAFCHDVTVSVDKKKNELEKQHHPYRTYKINYPFLDYEPHTDTYKKWINRFNVEYNVEYIPEVSKEESYRIP